MIPNDEPARGQMIQRMLDHLYKTAVLGEDSLYTEWERNFIDSVQYQFTKNSRLSQKQCEILERIYDK